METQQDRLNLKRLQDALSLAERRLALPAAESERRQRLYEAALGNTRDLV
jgi:hypothetical protein